MADSATFCTETMTSHREPYFVQYCLRVHSAPLNAAHIFWTSCHCLLSCIDSIFRMNRWQHLHPYAHLSHKLSVISSRLTIRQTVSLDGATQREKPRRCCLFTATQPPEQRQVLITNAF
jgi:hypothetical protein